MKKNKLIVIILIILVIVLSVVGFIFIKDKDTKNLETKHETYVAYVKINPLVKLTFDVNYKCDKENKCETVDNKITNIDLLNNDAKNIYSNLEYKDKSLELVVASLIDIAEQNNKDISKVTITSTYEFDKEDLTKRVLDNLTTTKSVDIGYNYQKNIDESSLIETTSTTTTTTKTTTEKTTSKCVSKKFKKKFTYAYKTKEECKKQGNNDFNNMTDNVDDSVFSYGCEAVKDDCGDTWYGVVFYKWSEEKGEYPYYY